LLLRDILAQFRVFAQGGDDWVNLLILVAVAFFWLVGAIAKVWSRKRSVEPGKAGAEQQPRETWQQRLTRKVEEFQRAAEAQLDGAGRRIEETRPHGQARQPPPAREPGGKITVRTGPRGESIMVYQPAKPQVPAPQEQQIARQEQARRAVATARRAAVRVPPPAAPKVETTAALKPMTAQLASLASEPPEPLRLDTLEPQSPRKTGGLDPAAIIDYNDPDALKKAILHYEIFGKPLALRKPSERAAGF
jgi:hypothetical protein